MAPRPPPLTWKLPAGGELPTRDHLDRDARRHLTAQERTSMSPGGMRSIPSSSASSRTRRNPVAWIVWGMILALLATIAPEAAQLAVGAPPTSPSFVDYSQCANDPPPSTSTACPGGWINGTLIANNSHYQEDQVVPQRAEELVPSQTVLVSETMVFSYLTRKGSASAHAYDSLATWNLTQSSADRCQGLTAAQCPATSTVNTKPIPDDATLVPPTGSGITSTTSAHMIPSGPGRVMTMYGAPLNSVSVPTHDNPSSPTSDDFATVTITYTPFSLAGGYVQLLFGGHLAPGSGPRGWGVGLGSSNINGGPYHIKFTSEGGRDNQIQSSAILLPGFA